MNKHLLWLWLWFFIGALSYMVKRAFYLITGPNPVANDVPQFIKIAGVPLGFRFIVDSAIYWTCFTPQVLQAALKYLGWDMAFSVVQVVTQFAVFALFFGLGIDPMMDWAIPTIIGKLPFFKDWWPQMPPPLHPTPPVPQNP